MNLDGLAGLVKDASGVDLLAAFAAIKSGDLDAILRYDVEPALKIAGELDPPIAPVMAIASFGIELFIAAHKSGMLNDLVLTLPSLRGADAQEPEMLDRTGPPGTSNI